MTFHGNTADDGTGGAISINTNSIVNFKDSSNVLFHNNNATQGGAIYSFCNSNTTFNNNTAVMFSKNAAAFGGALNFFGSSFIILQGDISSTVTFNNNTATQNGGAIYCIYTKKF